MMLYKFGRGRKSHVNSDVQFGKRIFLTEMIFTFEFAWLLRPLPGCAKVMQIYTTSIFFFTCKQLFRTLHRISDSSLPYWVPPSFRANLFSSHFERRSRSYGHGLGTRGGRVPWRATWCTSRTLLMNMLL